LLAEEENCLKAVHTSLNLELNPNVFNNYSFKCCEVAELLCEKVSRKHFYR